jgi:hypothetical protein
MSKHIKQIIAPTGDWFRIHIERANIPAERTYLTMSRVVAWAVVSEEPPSPDKIPERFEGIDSNGYGHLDEDTDYEYVHGDDVAPNGKPWRDVFNETRHSIGA